MRAFVVTFYALDEKNNPREIVQAAENGECHGAAVESARSELRKDYPEIDTYQWTAMGYHL